MVRVKSGWHPVGAQVALLIWMTGRPFLGSLVDTQEVPSWAKLLARCTFANSFLVFCWLGGSLNKIKPRPLKFLSVWVKPAFCFITEVGVSFYEAAAVTDGQRSRAQ